MSLKAETDMAMKLLEKDIHEKQDTIISLRRQLEDIKQINLEMYNKLQVFFLLTHSPYYYLYTTNDIMIFVLQLSFQLSEYSPCNQSLSI